MPIWQIQVYKFAIWNHPNRRHVPRNIDKIFKELLDVFGMADDILIVGHNDDSRDHDRTLCTVVQMCRKENLKRNKDKCYFRWNQCPFI